MPIAHTPTKRMTENWARKITKSCIEPTEIHHSRKSKKKKTNSAQAFVIS
jgi:hypothetical protein